MHSLGCENLDSSDFILNLKYVEDIFFGLDEDKAKQCKDDVNVDDEVLHEALATSLHLAVGSIVEVYFEIVPAILYNAE